jgi:hypothetical protein
MRHNVEKAGARKLVCQVDLGTSDVAVDIDTAPA